MPIWRNHLTALVISQTEMWQRGVPNHPCFLPRPKDQTLCKLNPKSMTSLRSGKTKINEYRAGLGKSKPRPSKSLRYHEKTPVIPTIYSKSPEQLRASRDLPLSIAQRQGLRQHTGFIPISAGIYSHIGRDISVSEVVALPFPVNGSVLMVRQHRRCFSDSDICFN